MKPNQFSYRRGKSWSVPNVDELSEIDFDILAEKTHLQFDENICASIRYELAIYVSQVRVFESMPLSPKRKSSLKAIIKACSVLEPIFEMDSFGEDVQEEFDPVLLYLWKSVAPKGKLKFDRKEVANYLVRCRENAEEEIDWPYRAGRRKNTALRVCLEGLHQYYHFAGGEGRGCTKVPDGTCGGAFLLFSKELLELTKKITGISYSKEALHNYVTKELKL